MKKLLAGILVLAILLSMAACGLETKETQQLTTQSPTEKNGEDEKTEASTEAPTEAPTEAVKNEKAEIAETVVFENDDFTITATKLEEDPVWGTSIHFIVDNRTDKNVALSGDRFVVNGITLSGWLYIDAAAGKKGKGELQWAGTALEDSHITEIATLSAFDARIVDTDSYDTLVDVPFEIRTSIADTYVQEINEEGELLWEQDGVTVIAQTTGSSWASHEVRLFIKNDTGKNMILSADNISVNGFTITGLMSERVQAGTVCYGSLSLFNSELEDADIEEIEEVSFTLRILDPETFSTQAESDELTLYPAK